MISSCLSPTIDRNSGLVSNITGIICLEGRSSSRLNGFQQSQQRNCFRWSSAFEADISLHLLVVKFVLEVSNGSSCPGSFDGANTRCQGQGKWPIQNDLAADLGRIRVAVRRRMRDGKHGRVSFQVDLERSSHRDAPSPTGAWPWHAVICIVEPRATANPQFCGRD